MADNLDNVSKAEQEIQQQIQPTNQDADTADAQPQNVAANEEDNNQGNVNGNQILENDTPQPTQAEVSSESANDVPVSSDTATPSENNEQGSPTTSVAKDSAEETLSQNHEEPINILSEATVTTDDSQDGNADVQSISPNQENAVTESNQQVY